MFTITSVCAFLGVRARVSVSSTFLRTYNLHLHMNFKKQSTYQEAICALNGLQSNFAYLQQARVEKKTKCPEANLTKTAMHLNALGIQIEDLNQLNIIHVSGTKGKGSTCAFTESILRHHGLKTGFYSSPHVISVNERIRINGKPLDEEVFATYFWYVFDTLMLSMGQENMPTYFMFLTVMAFYVFMKEKVDVAIIEVGIGGLYDCTNVIQKPVAVGVTSLGLDHVQLLGDTITKIAEQKAGIFKPSVPAYSVPQPENAMVVLKKQSKMIGCPLTVVPPFEAYEQEASSFSFGVLGIVQNLNASLAVQLSHAWLNKEKSKNDILSYVHSGVAQEFSSCPVSVSPLFSLNKVFINGIQSCFWPGRFQTVKKGKFTFYLDGAHTVQSIKYCVRWFEEVSQKEKSEINGKVHRLLLFNCTGDRPVETLLSPLSEIHFDLVLFSPNRMFEVMDVASDQSNFTVDPIAEIKKCQINREIWCHLMRGFHENIVAASSDGLTSALNLSCCQTRYSDPENTRLFNSLDSVLQWLTKDDCESILSQADHLQVLVTGSLHLVGGVLSRIKPYLG